MLPRWTEINTQLKTESLFTSKIACSHISRQHSLRCLLALTLSIKRAEYLLLLHLCDRGIQLVLDSPTAWIRSSICSKDRNSTTLVRPNLAHLVARFGGALRHPPTTTPHPKKPISTRFLCSLHPQHMLLIQDDLTNGSNPRSRLPLLHLRLPLPPRLPPIPPASASVTSD